MWSTTVAIVNSPAASQMTQSGRSERTWLRMRWSARPRMRWPDGVPVRETRLGRVARRLGNDLSGTVRASVQGLGFPAYGRG